MTRLIFFVMFVILFASVTIGVKSCSERPAQPDVAIGNVSEVVALRDGSTMIAPDGSVARDLVDWLAERKPGQKSFELGGQEFVGRSAEPTAESIGRIPRLAAMLRANHDVHATVVGHTDASGDPEADLALSRARAETLVQRLEQAGVSATKLTVEARGSAEPIATGDTPADRARNERVSLVLTRAN